MGKESSKKYYYKNRDRILERKKKYREDNKDKIIEQKRRSDKKNIARKRIWQAKWVKDNRDKINKRDRHKRKTNAQFNIRSRLSTRFRSALRNYIETDRFTICRDKNIDYKAIIEHLKPFPGDISNYHIDHIIPISFFDLTDPEQVKKVCSPINFQWMKSDCNFNKNDEIDFVKYPEQKEVWDILFATQRFIKRDM